MTEKQKEQWAAGAVLVILLLIIAWALFHAFKGVALPGGGGGDTTNIGGNTGPGGVTINQGSNPYAPPAPSGCGGGGECGCPVSPTAIQSLNQMLQIGANATNAIYAAGNGTIAAIQDAYYQEDPLYSYTTG